MFAMEKGSSSPLKYPGAYILVITTLIVICNASQIRKQGLAVFKINKEPAKSERNLEREEIFCFEDKCWCYDTTANCSHNNGRLKFVPKLPSKTARLIFSYNNLTTIPSDDFFKNVYGIIYLDLRHNGLRYIAGGAFRGFRRLEILKLDYNNLRYNDGISPVLSAKRLRTLYIRNNDLGPPPKDLFTRKSVSVSALNTIDMSNNMVYHLNLSVFAPAPNFVVLWAVRCRITSTTPGYLPRLKLLNLQSNALYEIPETCRNGTSLFPSLAKLLLLQNKISALSRDICLPNLYSLELSRNPISVFQTDMFNHGRFPSMVKLALNAIQPVSRIEKFAFRHPTLALLSLMYCNIPFRDNTIDPDSFSGSPHLVYLQLSHSQASGISAEKFTRLFGSVKNLQTLYLGQSSLQTIEERTFNQLLRLRKLYLHGNKLIEIPDGAFDSLVNLTDLKLSSNQLETVKESLFSVEIRKQLRHLDLSGNPFICDCRLMWFKDWYDSAPSLFNNSHSNYTCTNIPGTVLGSFFLQNQACMISHEMCVVIIACTVIFIFVITVLSRIYQYRWHIRLMLAFRGHGDIMRRRLQAQNFDFDIFVSCADEDEPWVVQHLLPQLEGRLGLRVCFHKRDFLLGKSILSNIVDSVKTSKRFLMVFSEHFAKSQWCQFELDLCLGHVLDNEDALIVTCLGDVASRDLTSTMTAVLNTTTYIQWDQSPYVRASFWNRLELCMRDVLPAAP